MTRFSKENIWTAIAAITAVIALVLSQLPPIATLWSKPQVELGVGHTIHVTNHLGRLILEVPVSLLNRGSSDATVSQLTLTLQRTDDPNANTTLVLNSDTIVVGRGQGQCGGLPSVEDPFVPVHLRPRQDWGKLVAFRERWSKKQIEEAYSLMSEARPMFTATNLIGAAMGGTLDKELTDRLKGFYLKNLRLTKGTFSLRIAAFDENGSQIANVDRTFTIDETHLKMLELQTAQYRQGLGVFFAPGDSTFRFDVPLVPPTQDVP